MRRNILFTILFAVFNCTIAVAGQTDIKAMTKEQAEVAASQEHLRKILAIEKFETTEMCRDHKQDALMCAKYVLNTPCESDEASDLMWVYCARYILLWDEMSDEILVSFPKDSQEWMNCTEMMSVFLAACTKTAIEDNIGQNYTKEMHVKSVSMVVDYYIRHKKLMDKLSKPKMRKMVKMRKRGKLESFLSDQYDKDYAKSSTTKEKFFIPE